MKARIQWAGEAMFLGESGSGHVVVMDGPPEAGGRNLGVRPMEMLLLGVPFVIITVSATLQGFNHNLVRAAASLGASPLTAFRRVTLPLIAPGVISGALFAFSTSFDEVVVTLFLAGPEQATLPRQMFSGIRENLSPTIAAAATLLIAFSVLLLLTLEWLRGRSEKLRTAQV
jgi:putative spermidine/putrescine transport system permease protein